MQSTPATNDPAGDADKQDKGNTTLEESSDENVTVKRKYLEMLEGWTRNVHLLNPMKKELMEAKKTIEVQKEDMVRLSKSLVEANRRLEAFQSGSKQLEIILDSEKLSKWSMEHVYKSRMIKLNYNLDQKKITGFEYSSV